MSLFVNIPKVLVGDIIVEERTLLEDNKQMPKKEFLRIVEFLFDRIILYTVANITNSSKTFHE